MKSKMKRSRAKKDAVKYEKVLDEAIEDDEISTADDKVKIIDPHSTSPSSETTDSEHSDKEIETKPKTQNIRKDLKNISLLMFLYFLQGIPLGLTGSLPFILSSRKVSYADQGTFSFAFWPFSLKLLWAPIVDSVFFKSIGRRKSWLIPIQYLLGIFLIVFASFTRELVEGNKTTSQNGKTLIIQILIKILNLNYVPI
jgi:hypothetical protein